MIGLTVLAIAAIWCFLSFQLARKLPNLLGIKKPALSMSFGVVVFALLMIGPFAEHIVGMWQFQKLCNEQTGLQIYPNAVNAKRARQYSSDRELLKETAVPIYRTSSIVIDLETNATIAQYSYFTTRGAGIGKLLKLGGEEICSIKNSRHRDHQKYLDLKAQTNLSYGD